MTDDLTDEPTGDLAVRAAHLAEEAHAGQLRKGTEVPYFDGHLQPVAQLVADSGGSDVQVAAAYLHDAVEDAGGPAMLMRIAHDLGPEVREIVEHLSDSVLDTTDGAKKESWATRKPRYLAGLADAPVAALEVSVADKVHNAESILDDHESLGSAVWAQFGEQRPEYQLWYYSSLDAVFRERIADHPLTGRLTRVVTALADRIRAEMPDIDRKVAEVAAAFASGPDDEDERG